MFSEIETVNLPLLLILLHLFIKMPHCNIVHQVVNLNFIKMSQNKKQSCLESRKIIIKQHLDGKTEREIAMLVDKSISTVHDIITRYKKNGLIANKQRSAQPRKLSSRDDSMILREVKKNPFIAAPKLTAMVKEVSGTEVNPETVRRLLRKNNFHGRVARKKPLISPKNQKERLDFARQYMAKDFTFWSNVLYTDESKFNLFGCDGHGKVWRKPNTSLEEKNMRKTVKHGGGSVMVWGCMAASGVGKLHFIDGIMDKHVYLSILKSNLKASVQKLGIEDTFHFYQDNDPKHSALVVKSWLLYNCPKVIKTPAQSPDLYVIEHLWDELGRRMQDKICTSREELKSALQEEWEKITPDVCKNLVQSMPKRLYRSCVPRHKRR